MTLSGSGTHSMDWYLVRSHSVVHPVVQKEDWFFNLANVLLVEVQLDKYRVPQEKLDLVR